MFNINQLSSSGYGNGSGWYLLPLPLGKILDTNFFTVSGSNPYKGTTLGVGKAAFVASVVSSPSNFVAYSSSTFRIVVGYAGGEFDWGSAVIGMSQEFYISVIITGIPVV
jgi:hypothetical protein